tara:strand:+ start:240 stop:1463 length:1224 start_codon:yes stop_codon:yes gene_type:complete
MPKSDPWIKTVRKMVKNAHGSGWVIEEQSGKIKILRRMPDGRRPSFITNLKFAPSSYAALIELFDKGINNIEQLNKPFKEAFELANIARPTNINNGKINWDEIKIKYKKSRVPNKISETNWINNEKVRIERACEILNAERYGVFSGKECIEKYADLYIQKLPVGSTGRKRNLLDVARFLDFAVDKCGIDPTWKPLRGDELKDLIGKREESTKPTVPLKPDELFNLIDSLYSKPELKLAVSLVGLYGLRPHELQTLEIVEDNIYVTSKKRNKYTNKFRRRIVIALDLEELPNEGSKVMNQFKSKLIKLPDSIVNAKTPKLAGDMFRQLLERHSYWKSLINKNNNLTPYSLRHGYAWRGAKYYSRSIPQRDLAALMGHDPNTHNKYYGSYSDEKNLIETIEKITSKVFK